MGLLRACLLVLAGLMGSLAQEDLSGKALIFPAETNTAYVILKPSPPPAQPLTSLTVCLKVYPAVTRAYALLSYATKNSADDFLLYKERTSDYSLHVGGERVQFGIPEGLAPRSCMVHLCVSWESSTGLASLWLDGVPLPRKVLKQGYSIAAAASIILGQEQDSMEGGFEAHESLVGEVEALYLWERVLSPEEVCLAKDGRPPARPVIDWRALSYEIKGNVALQPSLFPACRAECPFKVMQCSL
ncbi:C-reactive protein-like [Hemicordylus capensis]|uniref:C-reactive protein-like n=1 Tax=Hemicordylus capensis TaxID=884348 RepID=UPI0023041B42|nr:C-reactive protein-like [Hemicordylus capensis]